MNLTIVKLHFNGPVNLLFERCKISKKESFSCCAAPETHTEPNDQWNSAKQKQRNKSRTESNTQPNDLNTNAQQTQQMLQFMISDIMCFIFLYTTSCCCYPLATADRLPRAAVAALASRSTRISNSSRTGRPPHSGITQPLHSTVHPNDSCISRTRCNGSGKPVTESPTVTAARQATPPAQGALERSSRRRRFDRTIRLVQSLRTHGGPGARERAFHLTFALSSATTPAPSALAALLLFSIVSPFLSSTLIPVYANILVFICSML